MRKSYRDGICCFVILLLAIHGNKRSEDVEENGSRINQPQESKGERDMKSLLLIGFVLLLTGCADSVTFTEAAKVSPVGFWYGWWHGMILPFSWLFSLFSDSTAIYAIYNNGGWYDFGFVLGCGSLASSSTAVSR